MAQLGLGVERATEPAGLQFWLKLRLSAPRVTDSLHKTFSIRTSHRHASPDAFGH
jgi:hypothetical protein